MNIKVLSVLAIISVFISLPTLITATPLKFKVTDSNKRVHEVIIEVDGNESGPELTQKALQALLENGINGIIDIQKINENQMENVQPHCESFSNNSSPSNDSPTRRQLIDSAQRRDEQASSTIISRRVQKTTFTIAASLGVGIIIAILALASHNHLI